MKIEWPAVAKRVIIAHPMHLGDVVTALPLAGVVKKHWPDVEVLFCAGEYARPLVECCAHVDGFINAGVARDDPEVLRIANAGVFLNPYPSYALMCSAHAAGVPIRVGNLRRPRMWRHCTHFVAYSRAHSHEHTVDIVLKSLHALKVRTRIADEDLATIYGLTRLKPLPPEWAGLLSGDGFKLIVHPKSGGEGREWPVQHFLALRDALPVEGYRIFVTGVQAEGEALHRDCPELFEHGNVVDLTGQLDLTQFIALAARMDGIVASGTGSLHIAAALGIHALGVYPPTANINALRWAPIGLKAEFIGLKQCPASRRATCLASPVGPACGCMREVSPQQVADIVGRWMRGFDIAAEISPVATRPRAEPARLAASG